jgi:hypothetical protein
MLFSQPLYQGELSVADRASPALSSFGHVQQTVKHWMVGQLALSLAQCRADVDLPRIQEVVVLNEPLDVLNDSSTTQSF